MIYGEWKVSVENLFVGDAYRLHIWRQIAPGRVQAVFGGALTIQETDPNMAQPDEEGIWLPGDTWHAIVEYAAPQSTARAELRRLMLIQPATRRPTPT